MRSCRACGREVGDADVVCPHCGGDPAGGEAPDVLLRAGERYLLGFAEEYFGIWDREAPSAPVERFPRTDEGESAAQARFELLERGGPPAGEPSEQPPPPKEASPAPPVPASRNDQATAGLILGAVGVLAGAAGLLGVPLLFGLLAVMFGALGLRVSAQSGRGRGAALAGLSLGLLALVIGFFALAASLETSGAIGLARGIAAELP